MLTEFSNQVLENHKKYKSYLENQIADERKLLKGFIRSLKLEEMYIRQIEHDGEEL